MPRHIKNNWNGYVEKNGRRLTAAVSGERRVSDAVFSYYIHDEPEREREREKSYTTRHKSIKLHLEIRKKNQKNKNSSYCLGPLRPGSDSNRRKNNIVLIPINNTPFLSFNQGRIGEPAANNQLRRNSLKSPPNSPTRHNKLLDGRILVWFLMFRA